MIKSDSRSCLVSLVNPVKLKVDVWLDQHILPCLKILMNLRQQLFLCTQMYQEFIVSLLTRAIELNLTQFLFGFPAFYTFLYIFQFTVA